MKISLLTVLLGMVGCSTLNTPPVLKSKSQSLSPIESYAKVLKLYVSESGRVNFAAIAKNPEDLNTYVAYVSETPFSQFKKPTAKLAHFINAYNALSIYTVIAKGIPESHSGLKKIFFFYLTKMKIGGEKMSLYTFENEYIRKMGNERIHFALNCMALGCPKLPMIPFSAEAIENELKAEANYFFQEERNIRISHAEKKVYLTEILDFFTEDFVPSKANSLIEYVNQYLVNKIPLDYEVEFIPYNWTVNNLK